jgi:hypothetical protein
MTQERQYLHVATFLPVKRFRDIIPFVRLAQRAKRQAETAPGHIASALRASFFKRHFGTISVWTDRRSMADYVHAPPHSTAISRMAKWAADGACFAEWMSATQVIDWPDALERLKAPTFYYRKTKA